MAIAAALAFGIPLHASSDYESGKQAWEAGQVAQALESWTVAAESGDRRSMLELGRRYLQGLGVPQDYFLSHMWFNLAAAGGEMKALSERETVAEKMTSKQLAEAQERTRQRQPGKDLHEAVFAGDLDGLKSALAAGADVNARDSSGQMPLMQTANKGYVLTVKQILAAPKVDIDARAADGATALFIAAVHGQKEIIDVLMKAGANVNIPGPKGKTPVEMAQAHYGVPTSDNIQKYEPAIQALLQGVSYAIVQRYPFGKEFQDCDTCPKMVAVPPGTFLMGSPASESERFDFEGPQHQVTISNPFAVGKYEVTREQFEKFVESTGHDASSSGCYAYRENDGWQLRKQRSWREPGFGQNKDHPVECVNWDDAQAYVQWLSKETGQGYRLLTESEWEYVARAGTTGPFHFGWTISTDQANYDGNYIYGGGLKGIYRGKAVSVGSFPANRFGLHDVHGNVWEWVEDCWHENYDGAPLDGGAWVTGGDCGFRMLRGGSWSNYPWNLRSAFRLRNETDVRDSTVGFRVARTLAP